MSLPGVFYWQLLNFSIFFLLLFFLIRTPLKKYLADRKINYREALKSAEAALQKANQQKAIIQKKLEALEMSRLSDLERVQQEAEQLQEKIASEARAQVDQIRLDAERTLKVELQRATSQLRTELLTEAVAEAKNLMRTKINEPDQIRLQNEFVEKIQLVRP